MNSMAKLDVLRERLRDARGQRVVFLSHCLLNENVRYLGGAARRAAVDELVEDCRRRGIGICQMPCPEQRAWGGVLKRRTLQLYGSRWLRRPAPVLWWLFRLYTRLVYARMARRIAREIADYRRSGFEVPAVVGVGASPSCGVLSTLDMRRTVDGVIRCDLATLDRERFNRDVIAGNVVSGEGIFVTELRRAFRRRSIEVPFLQHDLMAELSGKPLVASPLGGPPLGSFR
jgi:predicted secreted protein